MKNFTDKDVQDFNDKLQEGYNRAVPEYLRNENNIDKDKEESFKNFIEKYRKDLKESAIPISDRIKEIQDWLNNSWKIDKDGNINKIDFKK